MSAVPPSPIPPVSNGQAQAGFESLIARFECLWLEGQRPALDEHLPPAGDERQGLLIELVHIELEMRLKAGDSARVEEYLQRYPELAAQPAVEWELIVAEHTQRARREPGLATAEYLSRFPHLRLQLLGWQPAPPEGPRDPSGTTACTPTGNPPAAAAGGAPSIPGYQVLEELGRGGMGVVYKAWQISLKRVVALKVIRGGAGREDLARFQTEAQAAARLRHPGIVQIYEIGEASGQPFLTLEYVEGGSLSKRLDGSPWPGRRAAELVRALAEAIHHAHQQGVIHRDLKPGNVLLGPEQRPLIADFGLAKLLAGDSDEHTRTGAVLGTPCYMAPEQAAGLSRAVGPHTDIHALGTILYELLTGHPPFRGESAVATVDMVRSAEPVPPSRLQPRVGRDLETVCLKCLRKQPAERYASAADLAEDLRRFLDGEPVRARPPSLWRRSVAWVRRRPVAAVLILSSILLLATVIAGLSWHTAGLSAALEETQRAQRAADANERRARQSEYASQMRLAQQSLRLGDPFVLPRVLDRFQPTATQPEDLRAFEWWYLTPYRQSAPLILRSHEGRIFWLAYAPDGRSLAVGGVGKKAETSIKVWDAQTLALQFEVSHGRYATWRGPPAAFGPRAAGWLAVSEPSGVTRWNLRTRKRLPGRPLQSNSIEAVVVHPDGRRLLCGGAGPVTVWDADKGTLLHTFAETSRDLRQMCLSSDGSLLATACQHQSLRLWDVNTAAPQAQRQNASGLGGLAAFPRRPIVLHLSGGPPGLFLTGSGQELLWNWGDRLPGNVNAVAISADERLLATGHEDGIVRCWDIPTRTYRGQLRWQATPITCLGFAPAGNLLAVGTRAGTVFQVHLPVRQEPERLQPTVVPCSNFAFSGDGKTLVVGCRDRTVKRIDLHTGQARTILTGFENPVGALAVTADGQTLATREGGIGDLSLWSVATGTRSARLAMADGCFAFSPDSSLLACGHEGIQLVDRAGQPHGAVHRPGAPAVALAFSTDGRLLATADGSGTIEFWDVAGQRLRPAPCLRQRLEPPVRALTWLADGTLVTGDAEGLIRFWQAVGDKLNPVRSPLRYPGAMTQLQVARNGLLLLAHGPSHQIHCWDLKSPKTAQLLYHHNATGSKAALSPPGDTIAAVGAEGILELWDCQTSTVRVPAGQPLLPVHALAFTPDGQTLITASQWPERKKRAHFFGGPGETCSQESLSTTLRFWDPAGGTEFRGLDGPLSMAPPDLLAVAPEGDYLAAGAGDGSVWLWDRRNGRMPCRRLFVSPTASNYALKKIEKVRARFNVGQPIYPEAVRSVAFSPDGRLLATAGSAGDVKLWDGVDDWREASSYRLDPSAPVWTTFSPVGQLVHPLSGQLQFHPEGDQPGFLLGTKGDSPPVCVAFGTGGARLAVAHQNRRIRLWDLEKKLLLGELIGHLDQVAALAFSPDGKTLASGGHDRTVKLWSVAAAAEVASLEQHRGRVFCLAFSPDGTTLASGGEGLEGRGEVYLWRAPGR